MKRRHIWLMGTVGVWVGLWLLVGVAWPVAVARAAGPAGAGLEIDISGPAQTTTGTTVVYTVKITGTLPGTTFVEYQAPPGFAVQATDPPGTQVSSTVWRWQSAQLGGNTTITITGTHSVASGCAAIHQVLVDDVYSVGQPAAHDQTATTLTDVLCVYLPVVVK